MEIMVSMVAFFALVVSWFVLPATPRTTPAHAHTVAETLAAAA